MQALLINAQFPGDDLGGLAVDHPMLHGRILNKWLIEMGVTSTTGWLWRNESILFGSPK